MLRYAFDFRLDMNISVILAKINKMFITSMKVKTFACFTLKHISYQPSFSIHIERSSHIFGECRGKALTSNRSEGLEDVSNTFNISPK